MDQQEIIDRKKKLDEEREQLVFEIKHTIESNVQLLKDVAGGGETFEFMEGLRKRIPLPF